MGKTTTFMVDDHSMLATQYAAPETHSALSTQHSALLAGRHLLLTLAGCPAAVLDDLPALVELVRHAAAATGATVLEVVSHRFTPQGVTVLALLAESHASLHTYPERGVAFWDCFTCGPTCDPAHSVPVLAEALRPASLTREEIARSA